MFQGKGENIMKQIKEFFKVLFSKREVITEDEKLAIKLANRRDKTFYYSVISYVVVFHLLLWLFWDTAALQGAYWKHMTAFYLKGLLGVGGDVTNATNWVGTEAGRNYLGIYLGNLDKAGLVAPILLRVFAAAFFTWFLVRITLVRFLKVEIKLWKAINTTPFFRDEKKALKAYAAVSKVFRKKTIKDFRDAGLKLVKNIKMPLKAERKSFFLFGSPGAGKTVVLMMFLYQIMTRKIRGKQIDRTVIYDLKGDFVECFGEDEHTIIIAPWDDRSWKWDLAKDVKNDAQAQAMANLFVPDTGAKDPMWRNSTVDLVAASMIYLNVTKGDNWTWLDMANLLGDVKKLREALSSINHEAFNLIEEDNVTTRGIMSNVRSATMTFKDIGVAWEKVPDEKGISVGEWVHNDESKVRHIILRLHNDYELMAKTVITGFFELLFKKMDTLPNETDEKPRRIWCILDEFATLYKIPSFMKITSTARSKGVCFIAGTQSWSQVIDLYTKTVAEAILNNFSTILAGQCNEPETASGVVKSFGKETFRHGKLTKKKNEDGKMEWVVDWEGEATKDLLIDNDVMGLEAAEKIGKVMMWVNPQDYPAALLSYGFNDIPKKYEVNKYAAWTEESSAYKKEGGGTADKPEGEKAVKPEEANEEPIDILGRLAEIERNYEAEAEAEAEADKLDKDMEEAEAEVKADKPTTSSKSNKKVDFSDIYNDAPDDFPEDFELEK